MVLCIGPAGGGGGGRAGPIVLVPGGLFWTRRRAGVGFRWVVPDTHDYFLPALIEKWCRHDYFLRRPKAGRFSSKSVPLSRSGPCGSVGWCSKGCTRTPTLAGWCSRCCVDGVVLGWCSKKLSQNPRWGGVPKVGVVLRKIVPMARWGGVPKVGVVFQ